jgi:ribosomal protein L10
MSFIIHTKKALYLQRSLPCLTTQKRYNTREAIHRYVEPDKFKKHMLSASQPYLKRKYKLQSDTCVGVNPKVHELHPLQKIYSNELIEAIEQNDFVLFIQHNYTPFQSERVYKNTLIKSGGHFYSHRNEVYKDAFKRLGIDQVQHLFVTRNSFVIGPIEKLAKCVIALRKMPQFLLLAGCIEKEVYTYEQLQMISKDTNLDSCRATLVSILETPAVELSSNLEWLNKPAE